MKLKLFLSLLGFFALHLVNAQKWCSAGATWYFQEGYPYWLTDTSPVQFAVGYDRASYVKDTIITGQACKVITDTGYYEEYQHIQPNGSIYTYSSGDTVYFLTQGRFLPYFYFGCHVGDTLLVPWGNMIVATLVDSTGMKVINGDTLRFYDYRAIDSIYACQSIIGGPSNGEIVECLGNTAVDPGNNSFSFDFSCMEWEAGYYLHCYFDDTLGLYTTDSASSCEQVINSIANTKNPVQIELFPNPTNSFCTLQLSDQSEIFTASVYDITGREIMPLFSQQHISKYSFNTTPLASGLYFIKVTDETGRIAVKQMLKK